jgi:uncharacterized protein (TIGR03067 family)
MYRKSSARGLSGLLLSVAVLVFSTDVSRRAVAAGVSRSRERGASGPGAGKERPRETGGRVAAGGRDADAVRAEKDGLKGTWSLEAVRFGRSDAEDLKEDRCPPDWKNVRLTFSGDDVVLRSDANPKGVAEPYTRDPSRSPKELDIGRGASLKEYIYNLQSDKLILAFSPGELVSGGTFAQRQWQIRRPRDFRETEESAPPIIWILKRVKR